MGEPVDLIPWELLALDAKGVAKLLGCQPRTVLEDYALRPDFPERIKRRPAAWVAGEVVEWRESHRAERRVRRR